MAGEPIILPRPGGFWVRLPAALWRRRRLIAAGALTATGLATMWMEYSVSIARAVARIESGSEVVSTRLGGIEFADAGIGTPVLIIHGSGGGFDQGLDFSRRLIDAGFRVIAPSRFGYLRSEMPADASSEAQADAFAALLDHLGLERVPVVAGSAGALSAVQFAIRYPRRCAALVLLVPLGFVQDAVQNPPSPADSIVATTALQSDFLFWLGLTFARDAMIGSILATDPQLVRSARGSEWERVERILAGILPVSARAKGIFNDARLVRSLAPVALDKIAAPTLAISLDDDRYSTFGAAAHIAANVRDGRLIVYSKGGHIWLGHDAEVSDEIDSFLADKP